MITFLETATLVLFGILLGFFFLTVIIFTTFLVWQAMYEEYKDWNDKR